MSDRSFARISRLARPSSPVAGEARPSRDRSGRGSLARVIAFVWTVRAVSAVLIAYPLSQAFMASGLDRFADGDRRAFDAGGLMLLEALRMGARELGATTRAAVVSTLILASVQLVPLGALIASVQNRSARFVDCLLEGLRAFPAFATLSGLSLLLQAGWLLLGGSILAALIDPVNAVTDERTADCLLIVGGAGVACGSALAGIVFDLARARVVARTTSGFAALGPSAAALLARPLRATLGWATPAVWSLAATALAAVIVIELDVAAPGGWRLMAVIGVHQLTAVAWVVLRARWLRTASQLVEETAGNCC